MDQHRDLVRQLFTLATCILEDTHIPISEGQSARLGAQRYRERADELSRAADNLAAIARVITVVLTNTPLPQHQKSRGKSSQARTKATR